MVQFSQIYQHWFALLCGQVLRLQTFEMNFDFDTVQYEFSLLKLRDLIYLIKCIS